MSGTTKFRFMKAGLYLSYRPEGVCFTDNIEDALVASDDGWRNLCQGFPGLQEKMLECSKIIARVHRQTKQENTMDTDLYALKYIRNGKYVRLSGCRNYGFTTSLASATVLPMEVWESLAGNEVNIERMLQKSESFAIGKASYEPRKTEFTYTRTLTCEAMDVEEAAKDFARQIRRENGTPLMAIVNEDTGETKFRKADYL